MKRKNSFKITLRSIWKEMMGDKFSQIITIIAGLLTAIIIISMADLVRTIYSARWYLKKEMTQPDYFIHHASEANIPFYIYKPGSSLADSMHSIAAWHHALFLSIVILVLSFMVLFYLHIILQRTISKKSFIIFVVIKSAFLCLIMPIMIIMTFRCGIVLDNHFSTNIIYLTYLIGKPIYFLLTHPIGALYHLSKWYAFFFLNNKDESVVDKYGYDPSRYQSRMDRYGRINDFMNGKREDY